jgi:hypothetical protein
MQGKPRPQDGNESRREGGQAPDQASSGRQTAAAVHTQTDHSTSHPRHGDNQAGHHPRQTNPTRRVGFAVAEAALEDADYGRSRNGLPCGSASCQPAALAWARPYGVPGASLVSWRGLPSGVARRCGLHETRSGSRGRYSEAKARSYPFTGAEATSSVGGRHEVLPMVNREPDFGVAIERVYGEGARQSQGC